jgi:hypothetical protein
VVTKLGQLFLKQIFRDLDHVLREFGFRRDGLVYRNHLGSNSVILAVQRDSRAPSNALRFTVELGITSSRLLSFFNEDFESSDRVDITDACWRERIGVILGSDDVWWDVADSSEAEAVARELRRALTDVAIPLLLEIASDERLRDIWRSGRSPGLTELQRLMNLGVFLRELGPKAELAPLKTSLVELAQLDPAVAGSVESYLRRL